MKIHKAFALAYELHREQKRKGTNFPYFVHILDTAKYLMYETSDEDIICAGILHDCIEDTSLPLDKLGEEFGEKVENLVKFCSEPIKWVNLDGETKKDTWKERKKKAIEKIEKGSEEELLVFLADKLSNILSIEEALIARENVWMHFNANKEDVEWYYRSLKDKLKQKLGDRRIFILFSERVERVFG